jgi:F420-0:gamma-glutamyl ligase-like protein
MDKNLAPIPSPYAPTVSKKRLNKKDIEAVKKLLGVECVFIVADTNKHDCVEGNCVGHHYTTAMDGFTEEQFNGIILGFAEQLMGN